MRYDRGYGRDYPMARNSGPERGYDYGLRGYRETAPPRRPVPLRTYGRGGYDRGYFGQPALPNRVTQRYNMEYVHPEPNRLETNYAPFGGDTEDRIVDATGYRFDVVAVTFLDEGQPPRVVHIPAAFEVTG